MLQTKTLTFSERCSPRTRRGQSIIVALLVLLLLGVAGALFVTIVARNLLNARHANRVVTADQYARAGITFADAQLSTSLDGADWRPPLQFALSDGTNGTTDNRPGTGPAGPVRSISDSRERLRYKANPPAAANPSDPDLEYLQAGFARYNTGAGRFLLRVTYNPVNVIGDPNNAPSYVSATGLPVPPGKYLKIESIGREGLIDQIDPTTYTNNRSTDRTQAYQVAYKPIGITDYARFETNPDNRSDIANLGVISQQYTQDSSNDGGIATPGVYDFVSGSAPAYKLYPVVTTYGASDAYLKDGMTPPNFYPNPTAGTGMVLPSGSPYTLVPGDGSIHANMPLRFFGKNVVYLNAAGGSAPLFQDGIDVVGNLLLDNYRSNAKLDNSDVSAGNPLGQQASLVLKTTKNGVPSTPVTTYVTPSNYVGGFDTQGGLIRDGSMQNDVNGQPRGIKRLEPPLMDAQDPASRLPRYKVIAMTSGPRFDPKTGKPYPINADGTSPSLYGYGKAIYIDNSTDIQADSSSVGGGTTLTDEWLRRTSAASAAGASKSGWNGHFYDPVGVTVTLGQNLGTAASPVYGIRMVRSDTAWKNPDGTPGPSRTMDAAYGATGLSASNDPSADPANLKGAALTAYQNNPNNDIVIHAEGNVRLAAGTLSPVESSLSPPITPRHITIVTNGTAYVEGNLLKGDPDSSITVLAHDYVCINTSQFTVGQSPQDQRPAIDASGNLDLTDTNSLVEPFNFGLPLGVKTTDATTAGGYGTANPFLYVSASTNTLSTLADFNFTSLTGTTSFLPLSQRFGPTTPTHMTLPLTTTPTVGTGLTQTDTNQLTVSRDTGDNVNDPGDVLLDRIAVLPMDIRIEAVLYAQTRSFFVIPGDWFNGKSNDTIDQFAGGTTRPDLNGIAAKDPDYTNRSRFPMYGQPIDLKITIDGAVSEARPADISAQSAWMTKWGWIPQYHGSLTGETAGHVAYQPGGGSNPTPANVPAVGLQIIYNPQAGYPYNPSGTAHYLRSDAYGRPLPFSPMLPVSTGLLYSGDSSEPPLLQ
jgi:hypothetical protein